MSHRRLDGVRFKTRTQDAAERATNVRFGSLADIRRAQWMSALPPKADMCSALSDVGFVPKADMRRYSITSSAMARMPDGMAKPSALAVLRLMTSSNLTSWMIGRSPGFSPLRILPA